MSTRNILLALLFVAAVALAVVTNTRSGSEDPRNDFASLPTPVPMERDWDFVAQTNLPASQRTHVAPTGVGRYFIPHGVARPVDRALLVFAPGSENLDAVDEYAEHVGSQISAVVIGVEVERADEDHWGQYYYSRQLIRELTAEGVLSHDARIVLAGFSGGGKVAMLVGAIGGDEWDGALAIGVNEDILSYGYRMARTASALELPVIVLNGTRDDLVTSETDVILSSIRRTGFRNVELRRFDGVHEIPVPETVEALNDLLHP